MADSGPCKVDRQGENHRHAASASIPCPMSRLVPRPAYRVHFRCRIVWINSCGARCLMCRSVMARDECPN